MIPLSGDVYSLFPPCGSLRRRPLLRRRRELLTEVGRAGAEAVRELAHRSVGEAARPGIMVSIATTGDLLQWHPHLHGRNLEAMDPLE